MPRYEGHRGGERSRRGGNHSFNKFRAGAGPRLPASLLGQVDEAFGSDHLAQRNPGRKRRLNHLDADNKAKSDVQKARQARQSHSQPSNHRSDDLETSSMVHPPNHSERKRRQEEETLKSTKRKKKRLPELSLPKSKDEDAENDEIEWLEYMLKKEKGKGKAEDLEDGLNELLDFADIIGPGGNGLQRDQPDDDEEEEEDGFRAEHDLHEQSEEDTASGDNIEPVSEASEADMSENDLLADGLKASSSSSRAGPSRLPPAASTSTAQQDDSSSTTRYVPPHVRSAHLEADYQGDKTKIEQKIKLDRRIQGLLNKLSEANIESIIREIETVYVENSRNSVTSSITDLILQLISSRANLLDSFVILYGTLAGALHRILGMEFGAHFTHTLVLRYHTLSKGSHNALIKPTLYETPEESKEALNLLTLISELYNAGVISSTLIYDLIRESLASFDAGVIGEAAVESLLKILRCCGTRLRRDDAASMKDIVSIVQQKTKGQEKAMSVRARFMIETLVQIKDGKGKNKNGPDHNQEAIERMSKFLSGLGRQRRLLATEPLRVGLADLLAADKRGKWWLVGAGWSGYPLVEREAERQTLETVAKNRKRKAEQDDDGALLELAKRQGMNTDIRRSIFAILMTSEDYTHACDRLNQLRFTSVQQREFVRVALHCCSVEKTYNPFYSLILNNLCSESYDHRFTLQYAIWDFIRTLPESGKAGQAKRRNVAKTLAFIIAQGNVDLTMLKGVEWTDLEPETSDFLVTCIFFVILGSQTSSPLFTSSKDSNGHNVDEEAISNIFRKSLSHVDLTHGLAIFCKRRLGPNHLESLVQNLGIGAHGDTTKLLQRGLALAGDALQGDI